MTREHDSERRQDEEAAGPRPDGAGVDHVTNRLASAQPLDAASIRALQRTAGNQAVLRLGLGQPLDGATRGRMENAFGTSFADVRTHTDPEAARLAREENASAFAVGNQIVFGAGEYAPGTLRGDALLAHELAHVEQQRDAETTLQTMPADGLADGALERDANRSALRAVAGLWGNGKQNALPALKSGIRLSRSLCGSGSSRTDRVNESAGSVESDAISVTIDEAERPVMARRGHGANASIEGSVTGLENGSGVAEIYRAEEVSGGNCSMTNAVPPDPIWAVRVTNGRFEFSLPWQLGTTPGIGRWVLVKAGDGTNYNVACAQIVADEAE